jgi:hypothetical protein
LVTTGGRALHLALAVAAAPPQLAPNLLTGLRLLVNCAAQPIVGPWLLTVRAQVRAPRNISMRYQIELTQYHHKAAKLIYS